MAKRFTETHKWEDPWFRKLPLKYKLFWQYLCDRCDNSGVWVKDLELAQFYIGEELEEKEALLLLNQDKERVRPIDGGRKWLIIEFIEFQYGELSPQCKPHQKIIDLLKKHRVSKGYGKGSQRVYYTLQEKEKEKEKDKEKEEELYKEKYKDSKIYQFLTNNIYFKNIKYPARLTQRLIDTYKNQDLILYHLKKMDSWLLAHPKKEKKNYERFILNWLRREETKFQAQNMIANLTKKI